MAVYGAGAPSVDLVHLQWAGSATVADTIVRQAVGQYRVALYYDLGALIPGYTFGLIVAGYLGWRVFWAHPTRMAAAVGACAALVAGLCNVAQDGVLLIMLNDQPMRGLWPWRVAAALSFAKFALLLVAAVTGLIALGTTASRLLRRHTGDDWKKKASEWAKEQGETETETAPEKLACAPVVEKLHEKANLGLVPEASWAKDKKGVFDSSWIRGSTFPFDPEPNQVGICLSGGGIRSATVALGALQVLQEPMTLADGTRTSKLAQARYLVSVSGGGYTSAAYQLAMHASKRDGAEPPVVFAPGSLEEDHLRRHSSYIADTAGQWATALGVLFRCVATGIVLIGLTITALGLATGRFYRQIPIVTNGLGPFRPLFLPHPQTTQAPGWPVIPWGVTLAVLTALVLAVLAYLAQVSLSSLFGKESKLTGAAGKCLIGLTGLLVALGIAIPALIWLSGWLSWQLNFSRTPAITTGSIAAIVTYFGALIATLWKKRTTLTKTTGSVRAFFTKSQGGQVLPNSMTQMLFLWLCLLVLIVAAILASGWVATSGLDDSWWALLPVGVLLFVAVFVDETWLSLHNFYRRRLVSAFSIPRFKNPDPTAPQIKGEETPLSSYGARPAYGPAAERYCLPEVRFAATANITGQDRTPPGRRAVPFIFGSEYIGGPPGGLDRHRLPGKARGHPGETRPRRHRRAGHLRGGVRRRYGEPDPVLRGVPGPGQRPARHLAAQPLVRRAQEPASWRLDHPGPAVPPRLNHLVREIFGIHPSWARMLLCTDGGHYDNLGLIELLRLGCRTIYCFDASGGGAPLADTLAGTLAVAREELGIDITLTNSSALIPGGTNPSPFDANGPLAHLNARISSGAVIVGDITYPGEGVPKGTLVFAQAALTTDLPYQVMEYSQNDAGFPRDSTADQWFNSQQFDAYQQLGRYLGEQAVKKIVS